MNRQEFVQMAAIMSLHSSSNETQARENARAAKRTALLLADELGVAEDEAPADEPSDDRPRPAGPPEHWVARAELDHVRAERDYLKTHCDEARRRIAELEAEKAAAPKGAKSR